jgi:toxin ParE1/3/4
MVEYRLTPAAEQDLEDIWTHPHKTWGVVQALHYIDLLTATFAELAQSPMTAPACEHIRLGYRCRSVARHLIYFRITDEGIAVIRILHECMDVSAHL